MVLLKIKRYYYFLFFIVFASCSPSQMPNHLGVNEGKFELCPGSPNCVNTQEGNKELKAWPFQGDLAATRTKVIQAAQSLSRVELIKETPNYLHFECTTAVWKFIDDVEFYFDTENKVVHYKSASRVGKSDIGANARRMKKMAEAYKGQ